MPDGGLQERLQALFVEELQDNLRILAEGVVALERLGDVEPDDDLVHRLFRAAHSLKGAAHSAGITDAVSPCHRLEEVFVELRNGARTVDGPTVAALTHDLDTLADIESSLTADAHGPARNNATGVASDVQAPDDTAGARSTEWRARVPVARLDHLVQRTGTLVSATRRVRSLSDDLAALTDAALTARRQERGGTHRVGGGADGPMAVALGQVSDRARDLHRQLARITADVVDTAQELRLQPFRDVTDGLHRAVRELCRATETQANLEIVGGSVPIDRDVGDALREPLLHLVRNAIDHGIERPESRTAVGKSPAGTVRLTARADGPQVVVVVADDGAGIDIDSLRVGTGLPPGPRSEEDLELAFAPGVSTAEVVTDVSGRGVGLDAVRAKVEALGGTIHLRSRPGEGTEAELRVPRTLAVLRAIVVDVGDAEQVALPLANVVRLHQVRTDDIERIEEGMSVSIDGRSRPAVPLAVALGLRPGQNSGRAVEVAVEVADEDGVLLVDGVPGDIDVVLHPLPPRLSAGSGIVGAAVLPSDRAVLVVNPSAVVRAGLAMPVAPLAPPPAETSLTARTVLLAEDSVTTRALERSILERAGYEVVVAVDGADALARFRDVEVDVVVSDVDMPQMSGIELCRRIRSSPGRTDTPVILVTSLASDEDRQRGLEAGANAYIVKSAFDQAALLDAVDRFV